MDCSFYCNTGNTAEVSVTDLWFALHRFVAFWPFDPNETLESQWADVQADGFIREDVLLPCVHRGNHCLPETFSVYWSDIMDSSTCFHPEPVFQRSSGRFPSSLQEGKRPYNPGKHLAVVQFLKLLLLFNLLFFTVNFIYRSTCLSQLPNCLLILSRHRFQPSLFAVWFLVFTCFQPLTFPLSCLCAWLNHWWISLDSCVWSTLRVLSFGSSTSSVHIHASAWFSVPQLTLCLLWH